MHKNRKHQQTQNDERSNSSGPGQEKTGECTLCKRISVCICQRCGDFYCSPECQRKDWKSHRYICFPMPPLVKPNALTSDLEIPVLSTAMLKSEVSKNFNKSSSLHQNISPAQEQNMRPRQQPQQHQNNDSKKSNVLTEGPPISALPANNSRVVVTGFRSPNRCCVRSLNDSYMQVARAIDAYGKTAPKLTRMPVVNSYAITHMDRDPIMYRVKILGVLNKNLRVLFTDYGKTAVRQLSELREISEDILRLQQHAIPVSLKDVENYSMNDELANFLADFEDNEFIIQYHNEEERNKQIVTLRLYESKVTLNQRISIFASDMQVFDKNAKNSTRGSGSGKENGSDISDKKQASNKETGQANHNVNKETKNKNVSNNIKDVTMTVNRVPDEQCSPMNAPFATRMLKANAENIDVMVLDSSNLELGFFGCIRKEDVKNLAKVQKYLENFKDDNEEYNPRINEYCIAKFEDGWYRAKVMKIPKKGHYTVFYVDYTNEGDVQSKDIRPYPSDLGLDCTTNLCLIHDLPEDLTGSMMKSLQAQIEPNTFIRITKVQKIFEQIAYVELPEVIKRL